jgi:heptosyltransferase III
VVGSMKPVTTPRVIGAIGLVGLHLSARKPSQRWPMERFAALAQRLRREHGVTVMLFWSPGAPDNPLHPGDDDKAALVQSAVRRADPSAAQWLVPMPTTSLDALIARLSGVDALICADGGAMHVAAGLGIPIVAMIGDSSTVHWRPWGVASRVLQAPSREVSALGVSDVHEAFMSLAREAGLISTTA